MQIEFQLKIGFNFFNASVITAVTDIYDLRALNRSGIRSQVLMSKIISLQTYRNKALEQRSFGPWQKRFGETYGLQTRLSDLSDKTLYYLAQPGDKSSGAYYEIIMGALELGKASKFHYLDNKDQLMVVDIHLFMADQMRFEMMRRLGWLTGFASEKNTLLEMVLNLDTLKTACKGKPPELVKSHPEYDAYRRLTDGDKEVFIRRMLREALELFKQRIEK